MPFSDPILGAQGVLVRDRIATDTSPDARVEINSDTLGVIEIYAQSETTFGVRMRSFLMTGDRVWAAVEGPDIHPTDGRARLLIVTSDNSADDNSVEIGLEGASQVRVTQTEIALQGAQRVTSDSLSSSGVAGIPVHFNATTNELFIFTGSPGPSGTVAFRTIISPMTKAPTVTPAFADLIHASGGTIYGGGAGTTHVVTTVAEWNTAIALFGQDDVIDIQAELTTATGLVCRGDKYGITGSNGASSGAAGRPGIIGCSGAGKINCTVINAFVVALAVYNIDHIWLRDMVIEGGQFNLYLRDVEGTAADPVRVAGGSFTGSGDASVTVAGWFQAVTSSGGTAPTSGATPVGAGAYDWGFSQHVLVEDITVDGPGLNSPTTGECFYLGSGSVLAGWGSFSEQILLRNSELSDCTSDFIDIKPGCSSVDIFDNVMKEGHFLSGAAMQILYVTSALDDRPSEFDFDPNIRILWNRIYDGDLTNTDPSSSHFVAQTSLCGILFAFNLCWGFPNGGVMFRLRSEKAASQSQSPDSEVWEIINNLGWMDNGLQNSGAPLTSPVAFAAGLIDQRNNIGPVGGTGFDATAATAGTDFANPSTIPTVDTVDADATWETYGPGAAFDLDAASALVGAGTSISDVTLPLYDEDISQRPITMGAPNHGPFQ